MSSPSDHAFGGVGTASGIVGVLQGGMRSQGTDSLERGG